MNEKPAYCRNCGAEVVGEYCARCGQREGRGDLHFTEAVGDIVGDVFTWDSRLWLTLVPLMVRPGYLTAEFIRGRRARYMPPFRLYIVISFLMFLLLSLTNFDGFNVTGSERDLASLEETVGEAAAREDLTPEQRERIERAQQKIRVAIEAAETDPNAPEVKEMFKDSEMSIDITDADSPEWMKTFEQRLEANAKKLEDDPSEFVDALLEYLPQMMFLMLPLFALLLQFSYLFSGFHYLQHVVFALHYHSFLYLFYLLVAGLEALGLQAENWPWILASLYLPAALVGAYRSSVAGAIAKSLFLYFAYFILLLLGFAVVSIGAIFFL